MANGAVTPAFLAALQRTLAWEGGYSNDPHDPGGETYCGISRHFWPEWPGWALVNEQPRNAVALEPLVQRFYWRNIWTPLQLDAWRNAPLQEDVFDAAVNMGNTTAIKCLQKALGFDISAQDGVVGPQTLAAVWNAPESLLATFAAQRALRYGTVVFANPKLAAFLPDWLRRTFARWMAPTR